MVQKDEKGNLAQNQGGKGGSLRASTTRGRTCGCDIIREALADYGDGIFVIEQIPEGSAGTARPKKGVRCCCWYLLFD